MSLDIRTVTFTALANVLRTLAWDTNGKTTAFKAENVYEEYPTTDDDLEMPAAAIAQVDGSVDHPGSTPSLAFEVVKSSGGRAVFKVGESYVHADIHLWAATAAELNAMVRALQDALNPEEARLGLFLPLGDAYFDQIARVTYEEDRADMTEERGFRNERRTIIPVLIETPYCRESRLPIMAPERALEVA